MAEKILAQKNLVVRHSTVELIEHWAIAVSGLVLLMTGIFELPVAKRYYIITIPGLGWTADFITSLYLHYSAALVFTAAAVFHVVYHTARGEFGLLPRKGDFSASITVIKACLVSARSRPCPNICPSSAWLTPAWLLAF